MKLILLGIVIAVISNILIGWRSIRLIACIGFIIGVIICIYGTIDWVVFERPIWGGRF